MLAFASPEVEIASAVRTQPSAIISTYRFHGKCHYDILANRLAEVEYMILVDNKCASLGRIWKRNPANRILGQKVLLLDFYLQPVFEFLETTAALSPGCSIKASCYQDTAIGSEQLHHALDGESLPCCLVDFVGANCAY
jgi:hypothetical protein